MTVDKKTTRSARARQVAVAPPDQSRVARLGHSAPSNRLARSHAHTLRPLAESHTRARANTDETARLHARRRRRKAENNINNSTARPTAAQSLFAQYIAAVVRRIPEERVSTASGNFKCSVIFTEFQPNRHI